MNEAQKEFISGCLDEIDKLKAENATLRAQLEESQKSLYRIASHECDYLGPGGARCPQKRKPELFCDSCFARRALLPAEPAKVRP